MTQIACTAATEQSIRAAAAAIEAHRDELTDLDREIGDGDHGENMARGFSAVVDKLDETSCETPGQVLRLAATTLISSVGGASGPLFGTALLRASTALGDAQTVTPQSCVDALRAAQEGVVARGKAGLGDKTMLDALGPAVQAAQDCPADDVRAALAAAADAAEAGAERTAPLQARKGRASYLGERSQGHVDPGARSVALILRAFAAPAPTP